MHKWQGFGALALGAAATMGAAVPSAAQDAAPTMLVIVAHPDDEIVFAPALADAAGDGVQVTIVYATSGDAGPGVSAFAKGPELAAARMEEARCASRALGLGEPLFLEYADGTLAEQAQQQGGPASPLEAELRTLIERYDPVAIITWGPDGGYGHADHRMVSAMVTEIVQGLDRSAETPKLLYPAIPTGSLPPVPELQRWATTAPELLAVKAQYDDAELARAAAAAQCHVTQFDVATRNGMVPLFDQSIWQGAVHFRAPLDPAD